MIEKIIGLYSDVVVHTPFNKDRLVLEVSNTQVALMVKVAGSDQIDALEIFEFNASSEDWFDVFYGIRNNSEILNRGFNETLVFYNLPQAILIPEIKFDISTVEDMLTTIHGDNIDEIVKSDRLTMQPATVNVYRVNKILNSMVNTNFLMVSTQHTYSKILASIFNNQHSFASSFLKIQFYKQHFIAVLLKYGKLQLIQSYTFHSSDDALYYILNILEQSGINSIQTNIELSGMFDMKAQPYLHLQKVFSNITFDTITADGIFTKNLDKYPAYYFTPYYNLVQ